MKTAEEIESLAFEFEDLQKAILDLVHDDQVGIFGTVPIYEEFKRSLTDIEADCRSYGEDVAQNEEDKEKDA